MKNSVAEINKRSYEFFNTFLNRKLKYVIKSAIPEFDKKQYKLTRESIPSEKYEYNITNDLKQKKKNFTLKTQVLI